MFFIIYHKGNGIVLKTGFEQLNGRVSFIQRALNDMLALNFNMSTTSRNEGYAPSEAMRFRMRILPSGQFLKAEPMPVQTLPRIRDINHKRLSSNFFLKPLIIITHHSSLITHHSSLIKKLKLFMLMFFLKWLFFFLYERLRGQSAYFPFRFIPLIKQPVVKAIGTALPKFNSLGMKSVTSPIFGSLNFLIACIF